MYRYNEPKATSSPADVIAPHSTDTDDVITQTNVGKSDNSGRHLRRLTVRNDDNYGFLSKGMYSSLSNNKRTDYTAYDAL